MDSDGSIVRGAEMKIRETQVLVIGSGLSGLTAAALLANRGLRVTLVEQHFQPGGSCGAFRRAGRTFDQGTAMLFGFGERGFNPHRFVMNELEEPISVIKHKYLYRLNYDGTPITFGENLDDYLEQLSRIFPEDIAGIRAFYEYISDLYFNLTAADPICVSPSEIPRVEGLKMFLRHPIRNIRLFSLFSKSAGDLMRKFVSSERVIEFFNKLTSTYCYTLLDETPAILAVTMFMDNHYGGSYYPLGSSQQLPGKLEKSFEENGGSVLYESRAEKIIFAEGRPAGAIVSTNEGMLQVDAEDIIYSGTLLSFYDRLVPQEHRSLKKVDWVKNLSMTYPSVVLYCVVDSEAIPKSVLPIEMMADNPKALDEKEVTMYAFSIADPSICETGEHVVMAIGPSFKPWPSPDEPTYRGYDYTEQKELEKQRLLDVLESHFPGFKNAVRLSVVATPSTIERYTMKERGCVAGPKQSMGQDLLRRQHAASEWSSLFFCGEATVMGTGSPAVTISGISAANLVLRKRRIREYRWKPATNDVVQTLEGKAPKPRFDSSGRVLPSLNMIDGEIETELHDLASACHWCDPARCTTACPASIDIRSIMRRLECGNTLGAKKRLTESLKDSQNFPCKECSADCEKSCSSKHSYPSSVQIRKTLITLEKHF